MEKNSQVNYLQSSLNDNLTFTIAVTPNTTVTMSNNDVTSGTTTFSCWDYWHQYYYPEVIYNSYPVYLRDQAKDKGKQAFEIIKVLKDKKFVNLEKVGDFIDLMDELIKIL